ncbi:hypothetical protein B0H10DRAFT_2227180 [Mycena sp. CBHHK59/15]|nr:hypothetical protein B0H10DRAFT_2227180 [Mycena sp. CBHHK59/15]
MRARHVKPESARLHSCRAAHPGAPSARALGAREQSGPWCSDLCRCEDEDDVKPGLNPAQFRLMEKFEMFLAIAAVFPVVSHRGNTAFCGIPVLLVCSSAVNQVCLNIHTDLLRYIFSVFTLTIVLLIDGLTVSTALRKANIASAHRARAQRRHAIFLAVIGVHTMLCQYMDQARAFPALWSDAS